MTYFPIMVVGYRHREDIEAMRKAGVVFAIIQIPWLMIESHKKQAESNHGQTIKRLAERGGLSASEAIAVLEDRSYYDTRLSEPQAQLRLYELTKTWLESQP